MFVGKVILHALIVRIRWFQHFWMDGYQFLQPKDVTTRKTGFWQNAAMLSEHYKKKKIKCLKISKYFLYLASSIITHFLVEKHVRVKIKEFVKRFKKEILMETN